MTKRLVIVSHVFPPAQHANAKRPYLMAKYLVRRGWDVTVLTSAFQMAGRPVRDIDGIHVACVPAWSVNWIERLHPWPRVRAKLMALLQGLLPPDLFAPWIRQVAKRLRTIDYERAILNVLPYAGYELAQANVIDGRWIIDFQESIYPFLKEYGRTSPVQRWYLPRFFALEEKVLDACGGVWFTSDANRRRYIEEGRVEASKTAYLPYFYDPELYPERTVHAEPQSADWVMVYGGHLDATWRSPRTFFAAWAQLRKENPQAAAALVLHVYGRLTPDCQEMAKYYGVHDRILVKKQVPYTDFLAVAQHADMLLFIDAAGQELFNPGKLADFFGAHRPVVAFTAEGSEVHAMLASVGMEEYTCARDDVAGGTAALVRLWQQRRAGTPTLNFDTKRYAVQTVCKEAEQHLLLSGPRQPSAM